VWTGQALGNYGAAIGASVNPVTRREIHASGGWGEVALAWSDTAHSTFGYGLDRPNRDQLVPGDKALNETVWGNIFWRAAPWLQLGLEGTWRRTQYLLPTEADWLTDYGMALRCVASSPTGLIGPWSEIKGGIAGSNLLAEVAKDGRLCVTLAATGELWGSWQTAPNSNDYCDWFKVNDLRKLFGA
jgi:hypothetical protein